VGEPVDVEVCCCCPFVFLYQSSAKEIVGFDVSDGWFYITGQLVDAGENTRDVRCGNDVIVGGLTSEGTSEIVGFYAELCVER
jgi:hypothetical protein